MKQSFIDDYASFASTQIDKHLSTLKNEDEDYRELSSKALMLLTALDNQLATNSNVQTCINELLQTEFEIHAKEEIHVYLRGFADGIRLLHFLDLL